jgi:hypothetical protein
MSITWSGSECVLHDPNRATDDRAGNRTLAGVFFGSFRGRGRFLNLTARHEDADLIVVKSRESQFSVSTFGKPWVIKKGNYCARNLLSHQTPPFQRKLNSPHQTWWGKQHAKRHADQLRQDSFMNRAPLCTCLPTKWELIAQCEAT